MADFKKRIRLPYLEFSIDLILFRLYTTVCRESYAMRVFDIIRLVFEFREKRVFDIHLYTPEKYMEDIAKQYQQLEEEKKFVEDRIKEIEEEVEKETGKKLYLGR